VLCSAQHGVQGRSFIQPLFIRF